MRPKVKSPVKHVSLAFSPQDTIHFLDDENGDALMVEIAKKWMDQMGIRNTQYIITRHHDTEHPHCHIVFNRIDNAGNLISDSNERIRNAKVCRALTKEYKLYFAPKNSKARNKSRLHPLNYVNIIFVPQLLMRWRHLAHGMISSICSKRRE